MLCKRERPLRKWWPSSFLSNSPGNCGFEESEREWGKAQDSNYRLRVPVVLPVAMTCTARCRSRWPTRAWRRRWKNRSNLLWPRMMSGQWNCLTTGERNDCGPILATALRQFAVVLDPFGANLPTVSAKCPQRTCSQIAGGHSVSVDPSARLCNKTPFCNRIPHFVTEYPFGQFRILRFLGLFDEASSSSRRFCNKSTFCYKFCNKRRPIFRVLLQSPSAPSRAALSCFGSGSWPRNAAGRVSTSLVT